MDWKIGGKYIPGIKHEKESNEILRGVCQDYADKAENIDNGIYAIALADGMGSVLFSQYGAETSVKTICSFLTDSKNFDILFNAIDRRKQQNMELSESTEKITLSSLQIENIDIKKILYDKIKERAKDLLENELKYLKEKAGANKTLNIKQLSSTLLFAAVKEDKYITGHIGDGYIAALYKNEDGTLVVNPFSYPHNGQYANETFFVTDVDMEKNFELDAGNLNEDGIVSFALMSDGTADGIWQKKEKSFKSNLKDIMCCDNDLNEQIGILLNDIKANNTDDDCSLIVLSRGDLKDLLHSEENNIPDAQEHPKEDNKKEDDLSNESVNVNEKENSPINVEEQKKKKTEENSCLEEEKDEKKTHCLEHKEKDKCTAEKDSETEKKYKKGNNQEKEKLNIIIGIVLKKYVYLKEVITSKFSYIVGKFFSNK